MGSHTVWTHPLTSERFTAAGSDGDDAKPYQEKQVRRMLREIRKAQRRTP
jgi:hypothetical protein